MDNRNWIFFAIFHRVILMLPVIILLAVLLWFFLSTKLLYLSFIVSLVYLLFFTIRDAFLEEKELFWKHLYIDNSVVIMGNKYEKNNTNTINWSISP